MDEKNIRVKKSPNGPWKTVKLLASGKYGSLYMVHIEDEQGKLWLTSDHIHPDDCIEVFKDATKPLSIPAADRNDEEEENGPPLSTEI